MSQELSALWIGASDDLAAAILREFAANDRPIRLRTVQNRLDLLRALENGRFDLMLAEYAPPDFDALLILESAVRLPDDCPLIVISQTPGATLWRRALAAGAQGTIGAAELGRLFFIARRELQIVHFRREYMRTCHLLERQAHDLSERVKELDCLYSITKLADRADLSLTDFLQELLRFIPPSWQYSSIACARIKVRDIEYQTENFRPSEWRQTADIVSAGRVVGGLEVGYLEKRPDADDGPFLREESRLIVAVAQQVGEIIARKEAEAAIRAFSEQILAIREEEKKRIANTLHDELGSFTVFLGSKLKIVERKARESDLPGVLENLHLAGQALADSIEGLKRLAKDLRPPNFEAMGLTGALEELKSQLARESGLAIGFTAEPEELPGLDEELAISLYRIAQEALNNAIEHSGANRVCLNLRQGRELLELTVEDNGRGFDPAQFFAHKIGLRGIQERARHFEGICQIDSSPGGGARVIVRIPLNPPAQEVKS